MPGERSSRSRIVAEIERRLEGLTTVPIPKPVPELSPPLSGESWTATIQAALDRDRCVFLPARDQPYELDGPLILHSGTRLVADPKAEFRLRPGSNTCMIRNEHIVGAQDRPVAELGALPDSDIAIEGGIWTTLGSASGNVRGRSAKQNDVPGCHGVVLLSNVRRVQVKNLTIRQSRAFGVHLSNCAEFLVDGVTFEEHGRDGVHVNGPASYGAIRNIHGVTYDDFVALNAWDWRNYTPTFGPIHHVLVEQIAGAGAVAAEVTRRKGGEAFPDGTAEIRLLPGNKRFADGRTLACDIEDCVFRQLRDIRTVKLYDQPNLELGRDKDFSDPIGNARNLFFSGLVSSRPGKFQIAANVDGLAIDDVQCLFDIAPAGKSPFALVEIGPMSATYKHKPDDPASWVEIFSPDKDVTVRQLRVSNVRAGADGKVLPLDDPEARLVSVIQQSPNPDYPKTTPRGGTGKGIWLR